MNQICFFFENGSGCLEFSENFEESFVNDLMGCFFTDLNAASQSGVQYVTKQMKGKLKSLLDKYQLDKLRALHAKVERLDIGDTFLILPDLDLPQKDRIFYECLVKAKGDEMIARQDYDTLLSQGNSILDFYEMSLFDGEREKPSRIGEYDKLKKVCRFCEKMFPIVTFTTESHAFPEGLGNRNVICLEECDVCNNLFSKTIEPAIISFFNFQRTLFGAHRKKNKPTSLSAGDVLVEQLMDGSPCTISLPETYFSEDTGEVKFPMDMRKQINAQHIYRALVKFVLACKPETEFHQALKKWVMLEDSQLVLLPKVRAFVCYKQNPRFSKLYVFERTVEDITLPKIVGQFNFVGHSILFMVPEIGVGIDEQEQRFENYIRKFFTECSLATLDLSVDKDLDFKPTIIFERRV